MNVLRVRTASDSALHPSSYTWNRAWYIGALMFECINEMIQGTLSVDGEVSGFGPSEGSRQCFLDFEGTFTVSDMWTEVVLEI